MLTYAICGILSMPRSIVELITLTVLWLVISHAKWLMSLGRAGCHIVTRPFFSVRVGSGTRLQPKILVSNYKYQTTMLQRKNTLHINAVRMKCQHFEMQLFYSSLSSSGVLDSLPKNTISTNLHRVRGAPLISDCSIFPPRRTVVCAASRVLLKSMWRARRKTIFQTARQLSPRSHAKRSL